MDDIKSDIATTKQNLIDLQEQFTLACQWDKATGADESLNLATKLVQEQAAKTMVGGMVGEMAGGETQFREKLKTDLNVEGDIISRLFESEKYKPLMDRMKDMGNNSLHLYEDMVNNPEIVSIIQQGVKAGLKGPVSPEEDLQRQARLMQAMMCDPETSQSLLTLVTPYEDTQKILELQDDLSQTAQEWQIARNTGKEKEFLAANNLDSQAKTQKSAVALPGPSEP